MARYEDGSDYALNLLFFCFLEIFFQREEKYIQNRFKSNRNQILFTTFRWIWNQTGVRLVPNLSENGTYNLISVWFNNISKRFLCVYPVFCGCLVVHVRLIHDRLQPQDAMQHFMELFAATVQNIYFTKHMFILQVICI